MTVPQPREGVKPRGASFDVISPTGEFPLAFCEGDMEGALVLGVFNRLARRRRDERVADAGSGRKFDGEGAAGAGRLEQYHDIGAALWSDAEAAEPEGAADIRAVGATLAAAMVDEAQFQGVARLAGMLRAVFGVAIIGLAAATAYFYARNGTFGGFGYGLVYFIIGLLGALVMSAAAAAGAAATRRRFDEAGQAMSTMVFRRTGALRDRLVALRASMGAGGKADMPRALAAAGEARLLTVAALRLFRAAPVIGVEADGQGYRCHVIAEMVGTAAKGRIEAGGRLIAGLAALAGGALIGAAALTASIVGPVVFAPPPPFLLSLVEAEQRSPGIVSLALLVAAALFAARIVGPFGPLALAAGNPAGALANEPLRGRANALQAQALAAAAERPRELIERYADAMLSLERRAESWSRAAAAPDGPPDGGDGTALKAPGGSDWRDAGEPPRFAPQAFAAAPPSFRVDSQPRQRKIFSTGFGSGARRNAAPKQPASAPDAPPWLND